MVRFGAARLLRTDPELALYGRYVVSKRLEEEGFEFQFPQLAEALADVLGRGVAADRSASQSFAAAAAG
jgi:NAD dependent epimerase/dehydratase family enzyme